MVKHNKKGMGEPSDLIISEHDDEFIDLVNEHDEVIEVCSRSEIRKRGLKNARVIHAFMRDSQGRLWIPRRAYGKKILPGALDFSVSGYVQSGESYEQAFMREAQEELRLEISEYTVLGKFTPHTHDIRGFAMVFEFQSDIVPNFNPEDFSEFFWLRPEEIIEKIVERNEPSKVDLPFLVKKLYLPH